MNGTYKKTKAKADEALSVLRQTLPEIIPGDAVAVTSGSYARREPTTGSDLDFFVLVPSMVDDPSWMAAAEKEILKVVPKLPSTGGAFATITPMDDLSRNIGGDADSNQNITRRMLFLLEGEHLTNEQKFLEIRRTILSQYVDETREDHNIAQYLLNDIIRYWRTMTVDYAFKIKERGKAWAVRNIKLVFSRKLLYAGGLFSVAMTADRSSARKLEILEELFAMPALERLQRICGEERTRVLVRSYDRFLSAIDDPEVRGHLETLSKDERDEDAVFRDLKNEGYRFTRELMLAFEQTFHATHPIHRAVIF